MSTDEIFEAGTRPFVNGRRFGTAADGMPDIDHTKLLTKVDIQARSTAKCVLLNGLGLLTKNEVSLFNNWKDLEILNLEGCARIDDLDVSLPSLQSLCLDYCMSLKRLRISFDGNHGIVAPKLKHLSIRGCDCLEHIEIVGCRLLETLEIKGLPNLAELEIAGLTELKVLWLSEFEILRSIKISECECSEIGVRKNPSLEAFQISRVPSLTKLDLSSCRNLRDIHVDDSVGSLASLNLSRCSSVSKFWGGVSQLVLDNSGGYRDSLTFVAFTGCKFWDLPDYLYRNDHDGDGNCARPLSVYLQRIHEEDGVEFDWAKVLVLGNGRAGKSTILDAIFSKDRLRREDRTRTETIEFKQMNYDDASGGRSFGHRLQFSRLSKPRIDFWDFPGQNIYHRVHYSFIANQCVYLIVWQSGIPNEAANDVMEPDWELSYWIKMIRSRNPLARFIAIRTHVDHHLSSKDKKGITSAHPVLADPVHRMIPEADCWGIQVLETGLTSDGYLEVSVPGSGSRQLLFDAIERAILELRPSGEKRRPAGDEIILREICRLRENHPFITMGDFHKIVELAREEVHVQNNAVAMDISMGIAESLHNAGVLFFPQPGKPIERNPDGKFSIVLDQRKFIDAVYEVFRKLSDMHNGEPFPFVSECMLNKGLEDSIDHQDLRDVVQDFLKSESLLVQVRLGEEVMYYVPYLLNKVQYNDGFSKGLSSHYFWSGRTLGWNAMDAFLRNFLNSNLVGALKKIKLGNWFARIETNDDTALIRWNRRLQSSYDGFLSVWFKVNESGGGDARFRQCINEILDRQFRQWNDVAISDAMKFSRWEGEPPSQQHLDKISSVKMIGLSRANGTPFEGTLKEIERFFDEVCSIETRVDQHNRNQDNAGSRSSESIATDIASCPVMLAFVCDKWLTSPQCLEEWKKIHDAKTNNKMYQSCVVVFCPGECWMPTDSEKKCTANRMMVSSKEETARFIQKGSISDALKTMAQRIDSKMMRARGMADQLFGSWDRLDDTLRNKADSRPNWPLSWKEFAEVIAGAVPEVTNPAYNRNSH